MLVLMDVPERNAQIFSNVAERAGQGALTRDNNIVVAGPRKISAYHPYRFLQPAPRPVSLNRVADPLRRRETEAGECSIVA